MENRPFPIPTGEAFLVRTPYLDKVADDIYKNEQAEKQRYYKENQMLDKEFSSELTKMRAVDIPDFEKKYGEFKQARIELMKKGNKATPQDYYSVLQKKSEAFRIPARSIEVKKEDEELLKDYRKNGKNYETHTPNVLYERQKTPLSQFEKKFSDPVTGEERIIDLNNIQDIVAYKGATTDFSKAFKTAAGTWMKRGNPIEEDTDGGLSRKVTTYKGYNSPAQFAGSLYEQVNVSPRSKRDFEEKHNYSDEEAANILDRYEQLINSPEFKNAYPDSEEIPAKLFQTKLGRAIALSTMKYMTDNRPQAEFKTEPNYGNRQTAKNKEWDRRNRITFGQSMQKIAANKAAGLPPEELGYVSDEVAAEVGKDLEVEFKGKKSTRRVVFVDDVDPERLNLIIGKDPSKPMQSGVKAIPIKVPQPDGTVIVKKGYYVDYNTGDWEGDNGQKISRERVKDSYINKYAPTKFKAKAGTKGAEQKQTIKGW